MEGQLGAGVANGHAWQELLRDLNDILGKGQEGTGWATGLGGPGGKCSQVGLLAVSLIGWSLSASHSLCGTPVSTSVKRGALWALHLLMEGWL